MADRSSDAEIDRRRGESSSVQAHDVSRKPEGAKVGECADCLLERSLRCPIWVRHLDVGDRRIAWIGPSSRRVRNGGTADLTLSQRALGGSRFLPR